MCRVLFSCGYVWRFLCTLSMLFGYPVASSYIYNAAIFYCLSRLFAMTTNSTCNTEYPFNWSPCGWCHSPLYTFLAVLCLPYFSTAHAFVWFILNTIPDFLGIIHCSGSFLLKGVLVTGPCLCPQVKRLLSLVQSKELAHISGHQNQCEA
jgi:hypothetical protein